MSQPSRGAGLSRVRWAGGWPRGQLPRPVQGQPGAPMGFLLTPHVPSPGTGYPCLFPAPLPRSPLGLMLRSSFSSGGGKRGPGPGGLRRLFAGQRAGETRSPSELPPAAPASQLWPAEVRCTRDHRAGPPAVRMQREGECSRPGSSRNLPAHPGAHTKHRCGNEGTGRVDPCPRLL